MEDIVIYYSLSGVIGFEILFLVFSALTVWAACAGVYVFLYLFGPFVFPALIIVTYRLITARKPALIVNKTGITVNMGIFSAGLIFWEEISTVDIDSISCRGRYGGEFSQAVVGIEFVDNNAVLARKSWWQRFYMRSQLNQGKAPIIIMDNLLPIDAIDLMAQIRAYRRQLQHEAPHQDQPWQDPSWM